MIPLLYALAVGLALYVALGLDDERDRRTRARAELARTLRAGRTPCPALWRDAHLPAAACPHCGAPLIGPDHQCKDPR